MSLKLLWYDPWLTKMTLIKGRLANIHWTPTLCKKQETEMEKQTHPDTPSGWGARCSYLLSCNIHPSGCLNRGCEPPWAPPPPTQHPYLRNLTFIPNSPMSVPAFVLDPTVPHLWTLEGLPITPIMCSELCPLASSLPSWMLAFCWYAQTCSSPADGLAPATVYKSGEVSGEVSVLSMSLALCTDSQYNCAKGDALSSPKLVSLSSSWVHRKTLDNLPYC